MAHHNESLRFSWIAATCISLYGLGSWIVVNGLWVELPILVNYLPEGWNLPAYLSVLIQVANLGPLVYVLVTRICRNTSTRSCGRCLQPPERLANYIILTVGLLACILLAHFWHVTAPLTRMAGRVHSVGLLTLALCAAIVDCTSSVTFVAYLTGLPVRYIGALHFGEAFSDLVPSSIALIQGVGGAPECVNTTVNGTSTLIPRYPSPRFSVPVFMYCLAMVIAISLSAFAFVDLSSWGIGSAVRRRYLMKSFPNDRRPSTGEQSCVSSGTVKNDVVHDPTDTNEENDTSHSFIPYEDNSEQLASSAAQVDIAASTSNNVIFHQDQPKFGLSTSEFILPVLLLSYSGFLTFGFLPAFQSYSSAAYSSLTYHLSVTLSGLISALLTVAVTNLVPRTKLAKLIANSNDDAGSFDSTSSKTSLIRQTQAIWTTLTLIASVPVAYVIFLASTSPNPPSLGGFGPALAVISWVALRAGFSGLRTWLWLFLSSRSSNPMALRTAGLAVQFGSALGAICSFLLVVQFRLFVVKPPCD